jgi:hypothetical protein
MSNISFNYEGKEKIILKGHIKHLCQYIDNKNEFVRR